MWSLPPGSLRSPDMIWRSDSAILTSLTVCLFLKIENKIKEKQDNLVGNMASQGTTPRQITDLIGSLCDLTSGSGDKGTPVVLVQGYFDNYTND